MKIKHKMRVILLALIYCRIHLKNCLFKEAHKTKNSDQRSFYSSNRPHLCGRKRTHLQNKRGRVAYRREILERRKYRKKTEKCKGGHLVFESPAQTRSQRILKPSTPPSISFQNLGKTPKLGQGGVVTRSSEARFKLDPRES